MVAISPPPTPPFKEGPYPKTGGELRFFYTSKYEFHSQSINIPLAPPERGIFAEFA
jgi:hypothetical protein